MKKEAQGDKETLDFIEEEQGEAEDRLDEIEEKVIDLLIPAEEYDDCQSVKLEVRAGKQRWIYRHIVK